MKKIKAFSLVEILAGMVILGFLSMMTIPTFVTNNAQKKYIKGYEKAYTTMAAATSSYLGGFGTYISPTYESAVDFAKFLIENMSVKVLYADENPTSASQNYAAIRFKKLNVTAGARNPMTVSPEVEISSKPSFWFVTDDNIAYSLVIPEDSKCQEVLNINTATTLDKTLRASCFAVIADTNGLDSSPNTLEDMQDVSKEQYVPELRNDRYYIFIGSDGVTAGNPKTILASRVYSGKSSGLN